jgi:hypothetical protein
MSFGIWDPRLGARQKIRKGEVSMSGGIRVYEIKRTFRAPLDFVYAWCTDFTGEDRKLQGETGFRKILRKTSRGAVYEDLTDTPHGWEWSRQTVTFHPPDRWTAIAMGNYRRSDLVYSLRKRSDGQTEFTMRGRRRATSLAPNPSKAALEEELHTMWRHLGKELERDYRRGNPAATR